MENQPVKRKVKDLPKGTPLIGLRVKIPEYLRSAANLLNKGIIVAIWDKTDDVDGYPIPNRGCGIWLSHKKVDRKEVVIYPCFLKSLEDVQEFKLYE